MRIDILFDREAQNEELSTGWGTSYLVNNHILFDTGESFQYLENNAKKMDIDLSSIDKVIISHEHWDHIGGLWGLLKMNSNITVYACPSFSLEFKEKIKNLRGKLIELNNFQEIDEDVYCTDEFLSHYKGSQIPEQLLLLNTRKGIVVICGCSHPGILKMMEKIKEKFPSNLIYLVFGGFHLIEEEKRIVEFIAKKCKEMNVEKIGPSHCTGPEAEKIFKEVYKENFVEIKAGKTLHI